jgi:DNA-binding LytR/AlgR family response regulator
MNCIIAGDIKSCTVLEEMVKKSSSLALMGINSDFESIKSHLSSHHEIDLVFLDLDSVGEDFLNFIGSLDEYPNLILASSSDQNALRAFDLNVVDYLLKPLNYPRFCKAIDKAIRYYPRKGTDKNADNELFIKKGNSLIKLKLKDIVYVEALENYVTLNTNDQRFTIHFTLKGVENQLPAEVFVRIHRSFVVNMSMIHAIHEDSLDLKYGSSIKNLPVGKSFRELLMKKINLFSR